MIRNEIMWWIMSNDHDSNQKWFKWENEPMPLLAIFRRLYQNEFWMDISIYNNKKTYVNVVVLEAPSTICR